MSCNHCSAPSRPIPVTLQSRPTMISVFIAMLMIWLGTVPMLSIAATPSKSTARVVTPVRPDVVVQDGIGASPQFASISDDGKYVALTNESNLVNVFDTHKGVLLRRFNGHITRPMALSFMADGHRLFSQSEGSALQWEAPSGQVLQRGYSRLPGVLAIGSDGRRALMPGGRGLNSRDYTETVLLHEDMQAPAGQRPPYIELPGAVTRLGFTGQGNAFWVELNTGINKVATVVQDISTRQTLFTLPVQQVLAMPRPHIALLLETKNPRYRLTAWDYSSSPARKLWSLNEHFFATLSYSPASDTLLVASPEGLRRLDPLTGQTVGEILPMPLETSVLGFSPNGQYAVRIGKTAVQVIDIKSWKVRSFFQMGMSGGYLSVSPDGSRVISNAADGTSRLWDAALARQIGVVPVSYAMFSADGRQLRAEHRRWQITPSGVTQVSGETVKPMPGCTGRETLYGAGDIGVTLCGSNWLVWHMTQQRLIASIPELLVPARQPKISNDGRYVALPGLKGVSLVDTANGQIRRHAAADVVSLAFLPDGKLVLAQRQAPPLGAVGVRFSRIAIQQMPAEFSAATPQEESIGTFLPGGFFHEVVFTADGQRAALATDGTKPSVQIYNLDTKRGDKRILDYPAGISRIAFINADRQLIAVAGSAMHVADARPEPNGYGSPFQTWYNLAGEAWVAMNTQGYFQGARNAPESLRFTVGTQSYPFDLFELRLNRPDLLIQELGVANAQVAELYRAAYLKRLNRAGFNEAALGKDFRVPEIAVPQDEKPRAMTEPTLPLRIEAKDTAAPLKTLRISVNGVPVDGVAGQALSGKEHSARINRDIRLSPGENLITVSVLNGAGAESERVRLRHIYTPPQPVAGKTLVIAIGVSQYADVNYNLDYADKDARDIASALTTGQAVQTRILTNAQVTRSAIAALREELQALNENDRVVLFVAGHGVLDESLDYYYATHDFDFNRPRSRGVPYSELEGLLDGIRPRQKLLLIDTCHSGEVDKDEVARLAASGSGPVSARGLKRVERKAPPIGSEFASDLQREIFSDAAFGSGTHVLSSASGVQFAFESAEWKNGVFTYAILNALRSTGADRNRDRQIQISELRDAVRESVLRLTQGQQTPHARAINQENDFGFNTIGR